MSRIMLNNFVQASVHISLLLATATTCVMLLYLLFTTTHIITKWSNEGEIKTVIKNTMGQSEIVQNINFGNIDSSIHFRKSFFWKVILIGYTLSLAIFMLWLAPLLFGFYILYQALKLFVKLTARSFQS